MHRQSLGSPNTKLHSHHHHAISSSSSLISPKQNDAAASLEDAKRKDLAISPNKATADDDEEVNRKTQKPHKKWPEKFIHLIPMLIIFCFLILYLSSRDPSIKGETSSEIDDFGGLLEIEKGDVLALRSMRNLQEIYKNPTARTTHRKFADF